MKNQMMTKFLTVLLTGSVAVFSAQADEAYSLVNDAQGYSYIQINQDVSSFTFVSDFKSIGNGGTVGFFVYPKDLEGQALKDYIANFDANDAKFSKKVNGGLVDLGALSAGDRVGFYEDKNGHGIVRGWDFQTKHDVTYIAFDKNDGTGKDEWMSIGNITVETGSHGGNKQGGTPSGQPLPGALVMLALGGPGLGALKLRKSKKA